MIDCLNYNGASVAIVHAQGNARFEHFNYLLELTDKPCSVPEFVGVITCCNVADAILPKQLDKNGIAYANPAAAIEHWNNANKPQLIVNAIENLPVQQNYALILDALDVVLNGHFVRAIPGYLGYNKPVLFGATRNNHPPVHVDKVHDRDWRGEFRYLNAGTAFGPREAMQCFYRMVSECQFDNNDSEQLMVRAVFSQCQSWVEFDWKCAMFQTLSNAMIDVDGDTVRVS